MKIVYLPRALENTRYTKPSTKGPPLPLDICLRPFVELNDGVSVEGPFNTSHDAHNWILENSN